MTKAHVCTHTFTHVQVNTQDFKERDTPLIAAVRAGSAACVRVLLKYGADPSPRNTGGHTAEVRTRMIYA